MNDEKPSHASEIFTNVFRIFLVLAIFGFLFFIYIAYGLTIDEVGFVGYIGLMQFIGIVLLVAILGRWWPVSLLASLVPLVFIIYVYFASGEGVTFYYVKVFFLILGINLAGSLIGYYVGSYMRRSKGNTQRGAHKNSQH